MKRHFSLKQNSDFQRLYRKGKYAATSALVLYWRPNRLGYSRLGITASTKLGHAVVRNKIRRRIREIYRHHEAELRQGEYLEVVEFSDFQVDSMTGDLFGEIRLAYWHDGETVTPVSGGSLSGSMLSLAEEMYLSRETVQYDNWRIPAATLLKGVTVTGIE